MAGNKALRRALATKEDYRVVDKVPLIVDTTELITPEKAKIMLKNNKKNRPINWRKVEEYAQLMREGKWRLHSQGIIIDQNNNLLTGQKRLWAVIYSGEGVYMRVSRGCPDTTANLLDRGDPQSARDLASRVTEKKHSPTEASIARAVCFLQGNTKPSRDAIADALVSNSAIMDIIMTETKGTKKTKSVLTMLAAVCALCAGSAPELVHNLAKHVTIFARQLEEGLLPETAERCWGRGAAFRLSLQKAKEIAERSELWQAAHRSA